MKLSKIKLNPDNPRIIKDGKFLKLVNSIINFPQMLEKRRLVCVTDTDKKIFPLGGNMRYKALIEISTMGRDAVLSYLSKFGKEENINLLEPLFKGEIQDSWVEMADEWTDEQRKEFIIKDNVSFGEWDFDELANNWEAEKLEGWGLDVPDFGTNEVLEAEEDDFDVPEGGIETDIVLGDLIEIGEHRLLCGDSTDSDAVAKLMNGEKADMVFTDPPYGIAVKNTKGDILGDENLDVFEGCMPNILLSVKEKSHAYIFFGSKLAEQSLLILNKYFKQYNLLIMPITNQTQPYPEGYFSSNYEICYFTNINGVKKHNSGILSVSETTKKDSRYNGDGFLKKYYALSEQPITEHNANVLHPTQKNVNGIDFYIKISSNKEDLVLDLFLGSGSTMVASHQLKRKCYGMELDESYCEVIVQRMRKLDPTLVIKKNGVLI